MKFLFSILLSSIILGCGEALAESEPTGEATETSGETSSLLTVQITGFDSITGFTRLVVFDSEDGFPMDAELSVYRTSEPVESDTVTFTIETLGEGTFAITVYHDQDGDSNSITNAF